MPAIVVVSGPLEGRRIEVEGDLTIGREGADLDLDDPEVSRRHALLRVVGEGLELEDLGSRNGTRVNGMRIDSAVPLENDAVIRVGQTRMRVEVRSSATVLEGSTPQVTLETPVADDGRTVVGSVPPPAAAAPPRPAAAPPPPPARTPSPAPAGRAAAPATADGPASPFGTLRPAPSTRRSGVASRLLVPMLLTYLAIAATAAALIIYFLQR
jgi:predicted component of type VI protein secretion system